MVLPHQPHQQDAGVIPWNFSVLSAIQQRAFLPPAMTDAAVLSFAQYVQGIVHRHEEFALIDPVFVAMLSGIKIDGDDDIPTLWLCKTWMV